MAAAMPRGMRLLHSCRGFITYAKPLCSRPQALRQLARPFRMQSTSGNGQPPRSPDHDDTQAETGADDQPMDENGQPRATNSRDAQADTGADDQPSSSLMGGMSDEMLEEMLYGGRGKGSKGGLTEVQEQVLYRDGTIPAADKALAALVAGDAADQTVDESALASETGEKSQGLGHKWPLPPKPYPDGFNLKKRYHPVVEQVSRLLMRDGKLAKAQRHLAMTMNILRTAPAPTYNPSIPLLPGTPPAMHLPLNPILYLTVAIDSVAPLIKIHKIHGAGGGGRSLDVSLPLNVRQRRRRAFMWILNAVEKKPSKGSGRLQFPQRLAEEIISVVEGRSSAWDKRLILHKQGTAARANNDRMARLKKFNF